MSTSSSSQLVRAYYDEPEEKSMEIHSNNGYVFLIDKEDFEDIKKYVWTAYKHRDTFYVYTKVDQKKVFLHRYLMGFLDNYQVDHKNRNGLDNRKLNLRLATGSQQRMNQKKRINSTYKYKGVSRHSNRFRAKIAYEGVQIHLGYFDTQEEAALAYNAAALELFGEYALLNEVEI